jgi:hypothetical protein
VVQQHAVALRGRRRAADDVHDGRELAVGAGDGVDGRQLADAKGGDDGGEAVDLAVAVGGVALRP